MIVDHPTDAAPIRVLLVEDNPGDARLILEMLRETQDLDFELESLESLAPALARLSRTGVDVVLLDLGLPDSQGLETFSRVQAHLPNDPIVVISGLDDQSVALDAVRAGAQDYLVKGRIEGQLLARVIRYAIERKRAEARLGAIVRFALDAHITMDPLGNVTGWNPQAEAMFGWTATEATGRPLAELIIPSAMRQRHSQGLGRFVETGVGPILNKRIELSAVRRDGTEFPIELSVTPIRVGNEWSFSAFLRDLTERKRAEESLRASEGRYRSLFESTPAPMWVYDLETLRILAVNTAAIAQYGYSADEFHEMTIDQLRPPEDVAVLHEHLARGTPPGFHGAGTWRHRRKDGVVITVEITSHEMVFEGRPAQLVVANDITARARAEAAQAAVYKIAHASHETTSLDALFASIHDTVGALMPAKSLYIALYDEQKDLITFPYFVDEMDPPPPARHPGNGITDYVLRTGQPLLMKPDMTVTGEQSVGTPSIDWLGVPLKTGERTIGVLAVQTYTPGIRYDERDKEMLQFVSTQIATAIERKRAEATLRDSEERFRALVERSGDAIALLDATGQITYASPSTAAVLGRAVDAVVGANAFDLLHPDDVALVRAALTTLRGKPGTSVAVRSRFRHGDETWHEGEGTVTNRLNDPAVRAVVFNYRDVTERARLENQLRQAQKMEAVGRLAGGVAHDFNNVLTAVFGYVDMLREELPSNSGALEDLAEVRKAAERAAGLTRQLLAFSRQQVMEPVVLRPNELLEDLEKMLHRMISEDVELKLALKPDVGNVRADEGQLQQVVMNLVVNARDAMPRGGKILIESANAELTEQYAELHQPVIPGRYVMIAVSDTGTGMTPHVKAHIFEPFFTTKQKGQGTGLGLSMVYGIVKQSGGYIWVYSEVGRGTTFKVYLPRVDAPAGVPHRAREGGVLTGTETILLAEDDAMLRPLAKGLLEKLGYRVIEAENGAQALAAAGRFTGPIQLLVADVVMPGGSGRDLARRLAETRPETKVLYVSGYTDDAIVHHGMLEPGLNFLQKPFTPAVLARKVREVLDAPSEAS
jgi:PAS domain S-box-containing protein